MLLAGFAIREGFSFWTGHPWDFEVWVRLGPHLAQGLDPYGRLPSVEGLSFAGPPLMTSIGYPPLWAYVVGGLYTLYEALGVGNRFLYYFLLKQPAIFGDLGVAYVLYKLIEKRGNDGVARWVASVWLFAPYFILVSAVWGMFDSLVVLLVLLALSRAGSLERGVLLGTGILLKGIPAIYLPGFIFSGRPGRWKLLLAAVALPVAVTLLPGVVLGWDLSELRRALWSQATKVGESISYWSIPVFLQQYSPAAADLLGLLPWLATLWIPAVLVMAWLVRRKFPVSHGVTVATALTLVFLLTRLQIHEQYLVYLFALLLLDLGLNGVATKKLAGTLLALSTLYLLANNFLLIRFVVPVFEQALVAEATLASNLAFELTRQLTKIALGLLVTITMAQYLVATWRGTGLVNPWVLAAAKRLISKSTAPFAAYFGFVWIGFTLFDHLITRMIGATGSWTAVLETDRILGVPIFGVYHLSLVGAVLSFNFLIVGFAKLSQQDGVRLFLQLFFLDSIAAALEGPLYRLLSGTLPLVGEAPFTFLGPVDSRLFFAASFMFGMSGLLLLSGRLRPVDRVTAFVLHRSSVRPPRTREVGDLPAVHHAPASTNSADQPDRSGG